MVHTLRAAIRQSGSISRRKKQSKRATWFPKKSGARAPSPASSKGSHHCLQEIEWTYSSDGTPGDSTPQPRRASHNAYGDRHFSARTYFDKSADKLNLLESATLIGMLKGTAYNNP